MPKTSQEAQCPVCGSFSSSSTDCICVFLADKAPNKEPKLKKPCKKPQKLKHPQPKKTQKLSNLEASFLNRINNIFEIRTKKRALLKFPSTFKDLKKRNLKANRNSVWVSRNVKLALMAMKDLSNIAKCQLREENPTWDQPLAEEDTNRSSSGASQKNQNQGKTETREPFLSPEIEFKESNQQIENFISATRDSISGANVPANLSALTSLPPRIQDSRPTITRLPQTKCGGSEEAFSQSTTIHSLGGVIPDAKGIDLGGVIVDELRGPFGKRGVANEPGESDYGSWGEIETGIGNGSLIDLDGRGFDLTRDIEMGSCYLGNSDQKEEKFFRNLWSRYHN